MIRFDDEVVMPPRRVRTRSVVPAAAVCAALVLTLAGSPARAGNPRTVRLRLERLSGTFVQPTVVTAPNDGSGRLFITEQPGRIRVRTPSGAVGTYLDIRGRVLDGGERGLLGLAFHPSFARNGAFFVFYTDAQGDLRISRFRASSPSRNVYSGSGESVYLEIAHRTYSNHNGGQLAFGPDGYLYIATGDGGGSRDPSGNAQNRRSLLGKILRVDVNRACGTKKYCIPSSNPYARSTRYRREIHQFGLRNPWRFSFDRATGRLWIADVGEKAREEINRASRGIGGYNWGWDCREGTLNTASSYGGRYCYDGRRFWSPLRQYGHTNGRCAIIGGAVYRGRTYASLIGGMYLYSDYCSSEVWALAYQPSGYWINARVYTHTGRNITSFGESPGGEHYVVDAQGGLYRIHARRA